MNRISNKIHSFYQILSPQHSPNFGFEDSIEEDKPAIRQISPEFYIECPIDSNIERSCFTKIFPSGENNKIINKEILKKPLLLSLEGFNASIIILQRKNKESGYFSMLFSYLNYLKRLILDFKKDGINIIFKSSFLLFNQNALFDLFGESKKIESFSQRTKKIFLQVEDIIALLNGFLFETSKEPNTMSLAIYYFQNEIFFCDSKDQISWKGVFSIVGINDTPLESLPFYFLLYNEVHKLDCNSEESLGTPPKILEDDFFCQNKTEKNAKDSFFTDLIIEITTNSFLSFLFKLNSEDIGGFLNKLPRFKFEHIKIKRNKLNDPSDYFNCIQELQKIILMKDYEISNNKLSTFLKEKENDELKLKIAQLESNLHVRERRVSIIESQDFSEKFLSYYEKEANDQILCEENENNIDDDESNTFSKKDNSLSRQSLELPKLIFKSESLADMRPSLQSPKKNCQEMLKIEGQEQVLEINYYDEMMLLREKFHKNNKEILKIKSECKNLKEENKEALKKEEDEKDRMKKEINDLKRKYEELQNEMVELYNVYYKNNFTRK